MPDKTPDWLHSTPLKTPAQLREESDAARRLERQRSRDCAKEQRDQGDEE